MLQEKLQKACEDVIVIGTGIPPPKFQTVEVLELAMPSLHLLEPVSFDYDWSYEEANLPRLRSLPGDPRPRRIPFARRRRHKLWEFVSRRLLKRNGSMKGFGS